MEYEINEQKGILDYKRSLDFRLMMKYIDVFMRRYSFIGITSIGQTFMGKSVPMITLGKGKKSVLYVGGQRGGEWLTSIILLRFINEYCELYKQKGRIYNTPIDFLYSDKSIHIVPMLHPDGVDYKINGLPHEYSGTALDGDADIGWVCNFLRFNNSVEGAISLRSGDEKIYYSAGGVAAKKSLSAARSLSRMSGYELASGEENSTDKLTEWCIREMEIPAFEIKCAEEKKSFNADTMFRIYADMREILFRFPFVI